MERLIKILESFRRAEHDECEDCFYSCPGHPDYCGHQDRGYCNCGLAEDNKKVDEAIEIIRSLKVES